MPDSNNGAVPSTLAAWEQKILANPAVAGALRQFFANWMGLPAGRYRVRLIENSYVPAADGLPLATDRYEPAGVAVGPTILMRTPCSRKTIAIGARMKQAWIWPERKVSFNSGQPLNRTGSRIPSPVMFSLM